MGSELEGSIHGWMHLHWTQEPETLPFDESPDNDWLAQPFSSHVNNVFWKLHGWIDGCIGEWEKATGEEADFTDAWSGPMPGADGEHHTAEESTFKLLNVEIRPLKIMSWKVPIIEGVTDSETLVQQIPQKGIEVEGVSQNGSFDEALAQAIQTAKEKLRTDFVRWELLKTSGENGGFILKNELRVQISAMGPVSSIEGITRK